MSEEKYAVIQYQGADINWYSDERDDYINLTDMAIAFRNYGRKSIPKWLQNRQTVDFLCVWEKKHNSTFADPQMGVSKKKRYTSIQEWIEATNAIGIFTRVRGANPGTWAHKDIAIRFASWLSPELELHLIEELQRLKKLEQQVNSYELLTPEQVLGLVRLKEVFKYVSHQILVEDAHKTVYASHSNARNAFAEFNIWRNEILNITEAEIDKRIKQYCINNGIALTKKMINKSKREKILMLDSYESVRNAVWDFLNIQGEVNALNLANLVKDIILEEKGEIHRENIDDLFHKKKAEFSGFEKQLSEMPQVKTARQLLAERNPKKGSEFDRTLKGIMAAGKPPKE